MIRLPYLLLLFFVKINISHGVYKLCAFSFMKDSCTAIEIGNSNVRCVDVVDSVDCAMKLSTGDAEFAVLFPEAAVLINKENSSELDVIGEIRYESMNDEENAVNMVVIMRKELSAKFTDLRGKNYCHSGVGTSQYLTDHFIKYFERVVVSSTCKSALTAVEEEVNSLSAFFGDSCRPGTWAQGSSMDKKLKRDYPNLCRKCDFPQTCMNNLHDTNAFQAALNCLTQQNGDVAYVSLKEANNYFGLKDNLIQKNDANKFVFLCKNETTMPITTKNPCIWGKQPWKLIVAKRAISKELKNLMSNWLVSDPSKPPGFEWQTYLRKLLIRPREIYSPGKNQYDPAPLKNYLDRGGVDDEMKGAECRQSLNWCTLTTQEQDTCKWISKAANTHGFKPNINCINGTDVLNCMQNLDKSIADVFSIYSEYGYIARSVHNFTTVAYEDNGLDGNYQILAVLKEDNYDFNSFSNLKGRKACFPRYNGLGWISFINMGNINNLFNKRICPEKFFGSSCVPGAFNPVNIPPNTMDMPLSMCSLCPSNSSNKNVCPTDSSLKESNIQAMICLSQYGGEVAFVNYKLLLTGELGKDSTLDERINPNLYKVLCKNGTIIQGLNVDNDCALAVGINAEVIGRTRSDIENKDTTELLLELTKAFGNINPDENGAVFRMFDKFNGEKKNLFKDTTITLINTDDPNYEQVNSYNSLLSNASDTMCKGSAHSAVISSTTAFLTFILWTCTLFVS